MSTPRPICRASFVLASLLAVASLVPSAHAQTRRELLAPPSVGRIEGGMAVVEGKAYLIGGFGVPTGSERVEIYDSATNTWSAGETAVQARTGFGIGVVGGDIFVVGGAFGVGPVERIGRIGRLFKGRHPSTTLEPAHVFSLRTR